MGTANYNFTYLDPDANINLVGDTKTFLDEIDSTIKEVDTKAAVKRVAIIGDSYSSNPEYYVNALKAMLPANIELDVYATGSTGFVRETAYGNGNNFSRWLNNALNSGKVYDQIIFYGGINDCSSSAQNEVYSASNQWGFIDRGAIRNAIINMKTAIEASTSYKAEVVIVPNEKKWSGGHGTTVPYTWFYQAIENACAYNGWRYVRSGRFWLWFGTNAYNTDGVHPTANGGKSIARYMYDVINGGNPSITYGSYAYHSNIDCGDYTGNCDESYVFENGKITITLAFSSFAKKSGVSSRNFQVSKDSIQNNPIPDYFIGRYVPLAITPMGAHFEIANCIMTASDSKIFYCAFNSGYEPNTAYSPFRVTLEILL